MSNPYGADVTGAIYDGPTACVVKFKQIQTTTTTTVIVAVPGKKLRVLSYVAVVSAATTFSFQDQLIAGVLTGDMIFDAGGKGVSAPYCPVGHFETGVGGRLDLVYLGGGGSVGGHITYIEVSA